MIENNNDNHDLRSPTGGQGAVWIDYIHELQNKICAALEIADGKGKFIEDVWKRQEGGGGKTRVLQNGSVFEKGGVNTSVVFGNVTEAMRTHLKLSHPGKVDRKHAARWFACGLSLVIHPLNPFAPTVHCNYRMFELYNQENELVDCWFGGGADLTPYYLFDDDAMHFHQTYQNVCDWFNPTIYSIFKKNADSYFVNTHRNNERRGIGGIFFDYQRESLPLIPSSGGGTANSQVLLNQDVNNNLVTPKSGVSAVDTPPLGDGGAFCKVCGDAFIESYVPIVEKRKTTPYTKKNKYWQEIRRGRYVEFNLLHDRGTLFGLKTNGRTESILMSLPPTVRFDYNYSPPPGSEEDKLLQVCLHPREWV